MIQPEPMMSLKLALCISITLSGCGGSSFVADPSSDRTARLEALAQKQMDSLPEVRSLALSVQAPGGPLVAVAKSRTKEAGSLSFRSASIGKTVMALTVLRLAELGRLSLGDRLSDRLEASAYNGLNVQAGRDVTGSITLRHLLSHTSGLADYFEDGPASPDGLSPFMQEMLADPDKIWQPEETLDYVRRNLPAVSAPGGGFHYSDTNYQLLGLVVQKASGKPLHEAYRELVFAPLGMDQTWMEFREAPRGSAPSPSFLGDLDLTGVKALSADWGGGGLVTTCRDLTRLMTGLFVTRTLLKKSSLVEMTQWTPASGGIYGLGLARFQVGSRVLYGHDGFYRSFALYDPASQAIFCGTLNQGAVSDEKTGRLWAELIALK